MTFPLCHVRFISIFDEVNKKRFFDPADFDVGASGHTKRPDEKTSRCLFNESQPHAKELFGHAIQRWNFSDQFSDNSKPIMSTLA